MSHPTNGNPAQETAGLRALLDAVHDALDVPAGACPTMAETRELTRDRVQAVKVAIGDPGDPAERAVWLRRYVAEHMPLPAREVTR
ncbi:hypothetical protein PWG71_23870 [Nocardiopsis sp. N85]|uniref:hypothetical protein n=1 Tax=Nocardiopsis sp. N85 TaxID=3029400 RepID=UPI00237F6D0B|nr:hypothetical protein [Nocardiopsis sp. N85]MDE3724442.1 hypothetical protein [Nocardiopsis sp. N85]